MKLRNILAYGDSLTWGYDPANCSRHAFEIRWTSVLADALGPDVRVFADGLNGRTTAYDDLTADCERNGVRTLPTVLHTHAPLDLVIIMLGTNDMKPSVVGSAVGALKGMRRLIELVDRHVWPFPVETPQVLIMAPPSVVETADPEYGALYAGAVAQSQMLASFYADLADECGAGFFDAGSVASASTSDGVHLDATDTSAIGRAVAPVARLMLGL